MPIISDDPPDLNPSGGAAFQQKVEDNPQMLGHKIVYPENLIKANSRYGNQFMALYINVTVSITPLPVNLLITDPPCAVRLLTVDPFKSLT